MNTKTYPSDISDEEWQFVVPYLTLMKDDAPQRVHDLRRVFDGVRYWARSGCAWRFLPHDFPPWAAVYQQFDRWMKAGVFEAIVHDLREVLRVCEGRDPDPTAAIVDSRTLQSTPESGHRAGFDGAKRKKGSKAHAVVDTLGHLLALRVTPANAQDRDQVDILAEEVQEATGQSVQVAYVDQGYTGDDPKADAKQHGIDLVVVKLPAAKRGFVLLPKRWVVERSFAWTTRFRRLAKDYERLQRTLRAVYFLVFGCLLLSRAAALSQGSA